MNTPSDTRPGGIRYDLVAERTATIVRSIASGNNACGTLVGRDGRLDEAFLANAIKPTLDVYESEAEQYRLDRAHVSQESEERRQVLEFIHANAVGQLPREVADRLRKVLGYAAN